MTSDNSKTETFAEPAKLLIYEPYPMGLGGNFQTQLYIMQRLDRRRLIPIVMSPMEGIALDEFRKIGVECVVMSPGGQLGSYGGTILKSGIWKRMKSAVDLISYNLRLAKFLRSRKIDVVYANCVRAEMSIGFASRLSGTPSLLYIKGELDNPVIDRFSFFLAKKVLFFCTQNKYDKYRKLVSFYEKKIDILPIGLDPANIHAVEAADKKQLREELDINSNNTNVVVLAQLYPPKGQHFVLQALARIVKEFPRVRVYFLGDHVLEEYRYYRKELEDFVTENHLTDNVVFAGWRRDALHVVSQMDIMIHPSLAEGFGRAVLESMALGKPVIASSVGGLREAIKDGENGFLVEPGNVDMIEKRWRQLLEDPQLREKFGQNARKTVFSEFLIDDKIKRLEEIWVSMCKK